GTRDPHAGRHRHADRKRRRVAPLVRSEASRGGVAPARRRVCGGRSLKVARPRTGKAQSGETAGGPEGKPAPFPDFQLLVSEGRRLGALSYERVNAAIPPDVVSADKIEEVLTALQEEGIEVTDEEVPGGTRFDKAIPADE